MSQQPGERRNFEMIQEGNIAGLAATVRFVLEIDKLKGVLRKVKPIGEDREHSRTQLADRSVCAVSGSHSKSSDRRESDNRDAARARPR